MYTRCEPKFSASQGWEINRPESPSRDGQNQTLGGHLLSLRAVGEPNVTTCQRGHASPGQSATLFRAKHRSDLRGRCPPDMMCSELNGRCVPVALRAATRLPPQHSGACSERGQLRGVWETRRVTHKHYTRQAPSMQAADQRIRPTRPGRWLPPLHSESQRVASVESEALLHNLLTPLWYNESRMAKRPVFSTSLIGDSRHLKRDYRRSCKCRRSGGLPSA